MKGFCHVIDGTQLRHAYASHDARGADAARAYANLNAVGSSINKHTRGFACCHVADNNIHTGEHLLGFLELLNDELAVAVRRVNNDCIHVGLNKSLDAVECVGSDTNASRYAQTTLLVLASHRFVLGLRDVFIGNQTYEFACVVKNRKLLNLVLLQYLCSGLEVCLDMCCNKVLACHHIIYGAVDVLLEAEVTVGDDADQMTLIVNNRNAADVIFRHQFKGCTDAAAALNGDGVVNHTILGTLHDSHLSGLLLDAHVLVNHTDASLAGNGNRHRGFCDCIHRSCHEGNLQFDVARKERFKRHGTREHLGIGGNQQDVVVGKTVHHNLVCNK